MARPIVSDPKALSQIISDLGGSVVANTWQFDLPRGSVQDTIPRLNRLGLGVRLVSERTELAGVGPRTISRLELYRPSDPAPDHLEEF